MNRRTLLLLAAIAAPDVALAQEPTRLPAVVTTATPDKPGARRLVGFVGDTTAVPVEGAEISIPALQRRAFSRADGKFSLDSVPRGKYEVRAKKLGFGPQIRTFVVDADGGTGAFALLPLPYTLEPVVTTAARGGLSGVVGDTAYNALVGAEVRVVGQGESALTDSAGAFHIPVKPGTYVVSFRRPGYKYRLVSVIVPMDSGKRIAVTLPPLAEPVANREAHNLDDLSHRLAWRRQSTSRVLTRPELERMHIEWAYDAVQQAWNSAGGLGPVSKDCLVIVNGGPATAQLDHLTVDDVESIEIYVGRQTPPSSVGTGIVKGPSRASIARTPITNTERATILNTTRTCPTTYVWMR